MKWETRDLDPREVFLYIKTMKAPNTKEIKDHFATDSVSVRVAVGKLMAANKVFPVGGTGGTVFYLVADGKRGAPNPWALRKSVGLKFGRHSNREELETKLTARSKEIELDM